MNIPKTFWLLVCLLAIPLRAGQADFYYKLFGPELKSLSSGSLAPESIERHLIRFGRVDSDTFYGTGLLFQATPERLYFLSVDHIIPFSPTERAKLRVRGRLSKGNSVQPEIIGTHPGYDISVIAIPTPPHLAGQTAQLQATLESDLYLDSTAGKTFHVAIAGIPDHILTVDGNPLFQSLTFTEFAAKMRSHQVDFDSKAEGPQSFELSASKVALPIRSDCAPIFLEECFHAPVIAWGFSGGTLLVSEANRNTPKIAGLVTHFSPLGGNSFVTPIPVARRIAQQMISVGSSRTDESGKLEWLGAGKVRLVGTDAVVTGNGVDWGSHVAGEKSPGGGESSAGGGESSAGGGESSAGGGESSAGGGESSAGGGESSAGGGRWEFSPLVLADPLGNSVGFGLFSDLVEQSRHPETWHRRHTLMGSFLGENTEMKGVQALLNFSPGITWHENDRFVRYQLYGGEPIINLQNFLLRYRKNPALERKSDFVAQPFPKFLRTLDDGSRPSVLSGTAMHRLKPMGNPPYDPKAFSGLQSILEIIGLTAHRRGNYKANGKDIDVITQRYSSGQSLSPIRAALKSGNGVVKLESLSPPYSKGILTIPDKFEQIGPLIWKYRGPVDFESESNLGADFDSYAVLIVQYLPEEKLYELKGISSFYMDRAAWEKSRGVEPDLAVDSQEIGIDSFAFTFAAAETEPKIEYTAAELALNAEYLKREEEFAQTAPAPAPVPVSPRISALVETDLKPYFMEVLELIEKRVGFIPGSQ